MMDANGRWVLLVAGVARAAASPASLTAVPKRSLNSRFDGGDLGSAARALGAPPASPGSRNTIATELEPLDSVRLVG